MTLIGLLALGAVRCGPSAADRRTGPAVPDPVAQSGPTDSEVRGLVGAGGTEPLLARTAGRVQTLFFSGGEYARRGQLLVKLTNHTFVLAPRNGFLGACEVGIGQYLGRATPVTTISLRSYLVILLVLSPQQGMVVHVGDSVHVLARDHTGRMAEAIFNRLSTSHSADSMAEIWLPSRAPFRIGEVVRVRFRSNFQAGTAVLTGPSEFFALNQAPAHSRAQLYPLIWWHRLQTAPGRVHSGIYEVLLYKPKRRLSISTGRSKRQFY